jgi:tetratricopeptide (TPR) repeat protein
MVATSSGAYLHRKSLAAKCARRRERLEIPLVSQESTRPGRASSRMPAPRGAERDGEARAAGPAPLADRIAEAGWLVALVVTPVLFNLYGDESFETEKNLLVRSVGLAVLAALAARALGGHPAGARRIRGAAGRCRAVVVAAVGVLATTVLATALSVAPEVSWWGYSLRRHGAYTELAQLTFFFAVLWLVRRRSQVDRLVTAVILASLPASLYAILQHHGWDPLPWLQSPVRVGSTAGNSIFLGAHLVMVVPLALARGIEALRLLADVTRPGRLVAAIGTGAVLLALLLQVRAIVYAQARGPLLGLLAGLAFFGLALAARRGHRRLALAVAGAGAAVAGILIALALHGGSLAALRAVPVVARLADASDFQHGTARVRLLLWEGTLDLLAAHPARWPLGHGPETFRTAHVPFYPTALASHDAAWPDRAHNATLDTLVATGALGLAAELGLVVSVLLVTLSGLGVARSRAERGLALGFMLGGALGGVLGPRLAWGSFRLAGLGLAVGLVAGLLGYLLGRSMRTPRPVPARLSADALLLTGCAAALVANLIASQVAFTTGVTGLQARVLAALVAVMGARLVYAPRPVCADPDGAPAAVTARCPPHPALALSVLAALLLSVLVWDVALPGDGWRLRAVALMVMGPLTWVIGALLVAGDPSVRDESWWRFARRYAAITLGGLALFLAAYGPWLAATPAAEGPLVAHVGALARHRMTREALLYGTALVALAAVAATLDRRVRPAAGATAPGWLRTLALLSAAVLCAVATNLDASRASVLVKLAWPFQTAGRQDEALVVLREAVQRAPRDAPYRLELASALIAKADVGEPDAPREALLAEALSALRRADALSPGDGEVNNALAALHVTWARLTDDAVARQRLLERAASHRGQALALSPRAAAAWIFRAHGLLQRGRVHEALEAARQATGLDPGIASAHRLLAMAHARLGHRPLALSAALTARNLAAPRERPAIEMLVEALRRASGDTPPGGPMTFQGFPAASPPGPGAP